jgi:hypothetical protein
MEGGQRGATRGVDDLGTAVELGIDEPQIALAQGARTAEATGGR